MDPLPESAPASAEMGVGHELGRYELLMPIASGGMAMVWAARLKGTRGFQKIVAVKTMLPKLSDDSEFERMFLDEASLASRIRHPHVAEIMDLGEQDGVLYLVMEWIDGLPLNQVMKKARKAGGIPLPLAVRIVMQACAGLHAAHELRDQKGELVGLVHRDVSPQNIMLGYDGIAKVVDFGIAKATALGGGQTAAGQVKGKIAYMAPEQIKGDSLDRRADLFAMGIILYALTTGKHPFRKESEAATIYNIIDKAPATPPRRIVPGYPAALERVVLQALAKDPAKRYPTANEFLRALDQALPPSMRASTDEDVCAFLGGLFRERRDEHREALNKALEGADQRARSKVSLRSFLDSQPPPAPNSGVTPVSEVSLNTVAATRETMDSGGDAMMPTASGQTLSSPIMRPAPDRKRWMIIAGAVAVVVLGGVVLALGARSNSSSAAKAPNSAEPIAAAAPTNSATPAPAESDTTEVVEASSLPVEPLPPSASAEPAASAAPAPVKHKPARHYVRHTPVHRTQKQTAKKTTPTNNSWKEDPGF